jgi:hypothetical protein
LSKISGEWSNNIKFDDKDFWINGEVGLCPMYKKEFILPSDSSFRKDLNFLIQDDVVNSQNIKEEYEEIQRKDRELRLKLNTNKINDKDKKKKK